VWFGVDVGVGSCAAAVVRDGVPQAVRDPVGLGLTWPAAVFHPGGDRLFLGQAAVNARAADPTRFQDEFMRDFGTPAAYRLGDREFTPAGLFAATVRRLRAEAERFQPAGAAWAGAAWAGAVVAVPPDFQTARRNEAADAARTAGFPLVEVLSAPAAAAHDWLRGENPRPGDGDPVLVYQLGGSGFSAALLRVCGRRFEEILPPKLIRGVSGREFDARLARWAADRAGPGLRAVLDLGRTDLDALRCRYLLADLARQAKHQLTEADAAVLTFPLATPPAEVPIDRREFERLIEPDIDLTERTCLDLCREAKLPGGKPRWVVPVGGSTLIPLVRRRLEARFEPGRVRPPADPDLAAARGAAWVGHTRPRYPTRPPTIRPDVWDLEN
jgi:molecular chaperone DnaK (HSP70)